MKLLISILLTELVLVAARVQVKSPLTPGNNSAFGVLNELVTSESLLDYSNILEYEPSQIVSNPRNLRFATPKKVIDYMPFAFTSLCGSEEVNGEQCFCSNKVTNVTVVEASQFGSLAIIGINDERKLIVLSYRFTHTAQSRYSNDEYKLVHMPGTPRNVGVHYGQLAYLYSLQNTLEETMLKYLNEPASKDYDLLVTGYSLGASIATLAAPEWMKFLKREKFDSRQFDVIAYAGSRVGNAAFADYVRSLEVPITRLTFQNDIVSSSPLYNFGFRHVGVEIHERIVDNKRVLELCNQDYDEDPNCILGEPFPPVPHIHFFPFGKAIKDGFGCDVIKS